MSIVARKWTLILQYSRRHGMKKRYDFAVVLKKGIKVFWIAILLKDHKNKNKSFDYDSC